MKLERVISHEHPSFSVAGSKLTVGRDGKVYLSTGDYVLRMTREGTERLGGQGHERDLERHGQRGRRRRHRQRPLQPQRESLEPGVSSARRGARVPRQRRYGVDGAVRCAGRGNGLLRRRSEPRTHRPRGRAGQDGRQLFAPGHRRELRAAIAQAPRLGGGQAFLCGDRQGHRARARFRRPETLEPRRRPRRQPLGRLCRRLRRG